MTYDQNEFDREWKRATTPDPAGLAELNRRIQIKNVRTLAMGPDGRPWSASVYFDGKRIGTIADYARGGEIDLYDLTTSDINAMRPIAAAAFPNYNRPYDDPLCLAFSRMADEYEEAKLVRKFVKKHLTFTLHSKGPEHVYGWPFQHGGHYWHLNDVLQKARETHGDDLARVFNLEEKYAHLSGGK